MHDFDRRFKQREEEFDRDWKQARKQTWIGGLISIAISLSVLGFIGWVIVKLMQFWGVI